jgi:LysR family transcriptional regulator for bpeEF and oprC
MNNYSDVAVFVRVVESNSFVNAAQALTVSPSAISKAVSRLEERLGARLLVRSTRSLRLTDLGLEYFERCREAFGQLDRADSGVIDAKSVPSGRLCIEVPTALGRNVVVPALGRFLELHPGIQLQVSLSDRPTDLLQGGIDAAIRVGPLPNSDLIARRVGKLQEVTCATADFLSRHGTPHTPADLSPRQCIALVNIESRQIGPWSFSHCGLQHVVVPAGPLILGDMDSAVSAALDGIGFVRALDIAVDAALAGGRLRRVMADWDENAALPVFVAYPNHRQPCVKIKAFIEWVTTLLPQKQVLACSPARISPTNERLSAAFAGACKTPSLA